MECWPFVSSTGDSTSRSQLGACRCGGELLCGTGDELVSEHSLTG